MNQRQEAAESCWEVGGCEMYDNQLKAFFQSSFRKSVLQRTFRMCRTQGFLLGLQSTSMMGIWEL